MNKINKQILIFIMLVLILAFPVLSADNTQLKVTLNKYEPMPAKPGQYVTAYIQIQNDGNIPTENAVIEIVDSFPFEIVSESERIKNLGTLETKQAVVLKYTLKVDSEAVVGYNKLKVRYTSNKNTNYWIESSLDIEVKPSDAKLTVNEIEVTPEIILPGEESLITMTIKNSANIVFRELAIKLDVTDTTTNQIPFIPVGSLTEKHVAVLKPGEITKVTFPIKTYPSAEPGFYKIPVYITFYDEEGSKLEMSDIMGFVVSAMPELKVVSEHTSNVGTSKNIQLKFINKGINDLKFLDVEILPSNDYKITSITQNYIGDLDSDDYRTEDFLIESSKSEFNLLVKTNYKDDNNKIYEDEVLVPVKVQSLNGHKSNSSTYILVLLILLVVGLLFYIVKLKKRHTNK
jgi:hypothetical protein